LLKEFSDILGGKKEIERHPNKQIPIEERLPSDKANNIGRFFFKLKLILKFYTDFTHSKKLGHSYRRLPDNYEQQICSGRTNLDKEVLNDKIRIYKIILLICLFFNGFAIHNGQVRILLLLRRSQVLRK
jgi:hypothetical protein